MIFLGNLEKVTETKYRVGFIHYMPFHEKHGFGKTAEELEQEGILVDSIPEEQKVEGKSAIMYANPSTKELWYEYENIPQTLGKLQDETLKQLGQEVAGLKLSNIQKDSTIDVLGQELANIKLQLMGGKK